MADSADHSQIASGEFIESAVNERSAEQSAPRTRTGQHELTLLPLETLIPLPVKPLIPSFNTAHDPAAHIDRCDLTGEKKRKLEVPGPNGTTID